MMVKSTKAVRAGSKWRGCFAARAEQPQAQLGGDYSIRASSTASIEVELHHRQTHQPNTPNSHQAAQMERWQSKPVLIDLQVRQQAGCGVQTACKNKPRKRDNATCIVGGSLRK